MTGPSSYSKVYTAAAAGSFATFDTTADALTTSGTYTYTTTATGYSAVASNTIVSGTVLGSLTVTGIPSSATAGMMYNLTVTAKDTTGAVMTSYTGPVALTSSDSAAIFTPQNYTFNTSDAGVHTYTVALTTIGTQSVTATALNTGPGTAPGLLVSGSEQGIAVSMAVNHVTVHPVMGGLNTVAPSKPVTGAGVVVKRELQTLPSVPEVGEPLLYLPTPLTPDPTSAAAIDANTVSSSSSMNNTSATTEQASQCAKDSKPNAKCEVNTPR